MGDLILTVTGNRFKEAHNTTYLVGNDITVDWGDGNVESLGTKLDHSYSDGLTEHIITISNVTGLGDTCFGRCTNLISVIIPSTLTSIGPYCFENCTGLKTMVFLGSSAPYAGYKSFDNVPSSCVICVPNAQSTSVYSEEENYPSPNTYHYTLNNILSLNGSLSELGEVMASNLYDMGVTTADPTDGLTSLANDILNIEPSTNIDLDIDCTLSSSSSSIVSGSSVILSALLLASYDATPASLKTGEITGATILFKEGNTTVGTGTTGLDGIATATISNLSVGEHTFKAIFEGTTNFDSAESSTVTVTVVVPTPDDISIAKTAGKQILSYADVTAQGNTEYCTLTATVLDAGDNPLSGQTVTLYKQVGSTADPTTDTVIGTMTDNNDGTYDYTYTSLGAGDCNFYAKVGSLLSETYSIEDCDYYDTTIYSSTTTINKAMLNTTACTVEFDLVKGASGGGAYLHVGDDSNNFIGVGLIGSGYYGFLLQHNNTRVTTETSTNLPNGTYHVEFSYDNGSITCKINNQTKTYTYTQPITTILKADCWSSSQIKNIKVKKL